MSVSMLDEQLLFVLISIRKRVPVEGQIHLKKADGFLLLTG